MNIPNKRLFWIGLLCWFVVIILYFRDLILQVDIIKKSSLDQSDPRVKSMNPLNGCLHVFLDVGANRGIQTRKVYEPNLFPDAPILQLLDKYFGNFTSRNLSEICSVGFEPNPLHKKILKETEAAYKKCGWKVFFHTKTGVGKDDSFQRYARIEKIEGAFWGHDVAGRLIEDDADYGEKLNKNINQKFDNIKSLRLARYLLEVVAQRELPPSSKHTRPQVVMKLDIEGRELQVMPDLVMSGALSVVDEIHVDWTRADPYVDVEKCAALGGAMQLLTELGRQAGLQHECVIEAVDDETFTGFDGPLPKC